MSQPDTTSFYYVSEERKKANRASNKADIPDLIKCYDEVVIREQEATDDLFGNLYDQSEGPDKLKINVDNYAKDDLLFCLYKNVYYRAKIIGIVKRGGQKVFKIHYHGWNKRFDEQVSMKDAILRFRPFDESIGALNRLNENQRKIQEKPKKPLPKKVSKEEIDFQNLPRELAQILLIDQKNSKAHKYPKIPGRITMHQIVNEYKEQLNKSDAKYLNLFVDSLLHGFDKYTRLFLIFENEWKTYDALKKSSAELCGQTFIPHNHYGFVHLLRVCGSMEKFYTKIGLDVKFIEFSEDKLPDFLDFLAKNVKKYYNPTEDYQ